LSWRLPVPVSFLIFGKFSAIILLNILHIPLAYTSSPHLMPVICRFDLLKDFLSSSVFLSQLLSLLSTNSFFFFNICFVLSPEIVSSTCSSQLQWLLTVYFIWF
jgi:hypothetical protein